MSLMADVVGSTMGPRGKGVAISPGYGTMPYITQDGVNVTRSFMIEEQYENVGIMMLRGAAEKTLKDAGDGTSLTVIMGRAIIGQGLAAIKQGHSQQDLKRGIDKAVKLIVAELKKHSEQIDDAKLLSIATISANNDVELGTIIADAYKQIGKDGRIDVEMSNSVETYTKIVEGFEIDRGYMAREYVNVESKGTVEYNNPQILVVNYDITNINEILPALQFMVTSGKPIIIMAKGVEGEAHSTFIVNKTKHNVPICAVKVSNFYQRECLDDIAVITNATLISDDKGLKIENIVVEHLGSCDKIIINQNRTTIIGGKGSPADVKKRSDEIKAMIKEENDDDVITVHETRLARLNASIGVMYVGAATPVEAKEKYDRVDDAVRAAKSAIEEGISVGGGIAFIQCIPLLDNVQCDNPSEKAGVKIIQNALDEPLLQILDNAGEDEAKITVNIISNNERCCGNKAPNYGYNVKTEKFGDLKEMGVIDPTKVLRVALQNSSSVAGSLIATDTLVVAMLNKV
jgi:chaperonin GroEL